MAQSARSPHATDEVGTGRLQAVDRLVQFKVIVAIDFGTHGTGLGYAIVPYDENGKFDESKEAEIYIEQDWSRNTDNKTKTDILLNSDGNFIAFGDAALEQYTRMTDDDFSDSDSSGDDDDEDDDKEENQEEIQKRLLQKLQQKRMLFESFKMALYEKRQDGSDGDIRDKLLCQDGKRTYETQKVFIAALKFMKDQIFNVFQKKKVKINGIQDIQWILTVPAIWSDRAKHKMEAWAQRAGLIDRNIFNHLRIVYEPDCASISCQFEAANEDEKSFQPGERYILIDAGGGTVDIACHQVKAEYEMEEIYHPTGGPWGSDYIDDEFERLLMEIFSEEAIRPFKEYKNSAYTAIKDNFRKAKMTFYNTPNDQFHRIQVTNEFMDAMCTYTPQKFKQILSGADFDESDMDYTNKAFAKIVSSAQPYGLEAGHLKADEAYLYFSAEIWKKYLFDKVIDPMINHVTDLIAKVKEIKDKSGQKKPLVYLCIAGGLASSRYFQNRIHSAFGKGSQYDLSIRIPRRPILSVIDGALRLGLRPNYIKTRKVKYTYGIAVDRSEKNVEKNRLPQGYLDKNTYIHGNTHRRTVRNLFSAFIKKNESVDLQEAIEKQYRRFHKNEKTAKISIYYSSEADPYYIKEDQTPLASVLIEFPAEYQGLPFVVQFFFGDTKIRAKVLYKDKKDDDGKRILMNDLDLEFHDLYVSK